MSSHMNLIRFFAHARKSYFTFIYISPCFVKVFYTFPRFPAPLLNKQRNNPSFLSISRHKISPKSCVFSVKFHVISVNLLAFWPLFRYTYFAGRWTSMSILPHDPIKDKKFTERNCNTLQTSTNDDRYKRTTFKHPMFYSIQLLRRRPDSPGGNHRGVFILPAHDPTLPERNHRLGSGFFLHFPHQKPGQHEKKVDQGRI